ELLLLPVVQPFKDAVMVYEPVERPLCMCFEDGHVEGGAEQLLVGRTLGFAGRLHRNVVMKQTRLEVEVPLAVWRDRKEGGQVQTGVLMLKLNRPFAEAGVALLSKASIKFEQFLIALG